MPKRFPFYIALFFMTSTFFNNLNCLLVVLLSLNILSCGDRSRYEGKELKVIMSRHRNFWLRRQRHKDQSRLSDLDKGLDIDDSNYLDQLFRVLNIR